MGTGIGGRTWAGVDCSADVTVVHVGTATELPRAARTCGAAAARAEAAKFNRYVEDDGRVGGRRFVPFVVEDGGRLGEHAYALLEELAGRRVERRGETDWAEGDRGGFRGRLMGRWLARVSAAVIGTRAATLREEYVRAGGGSG